MISLARFFSNKSHMARLIPVVEGRSATSLRLIDWFVTNYAKKLGVIIDRKQGNNVIHFNVYLSYRSQLKAFSKKMFDPFRRCDRIKFVYDKGKTIETTIGQLNFFRWIIENDIIEFVEAHLAEIAADIDASHAKPEGDARTKKKRPESSRLPVKNAVQLFEGAHLVHFS